MLWYSIEKCLLCICLNTVVYLSPVVHSTFQHNRVLRIGYWSDIIVCIYLTEQVKVSFTNWLCNNCKNFFVDVTLVRLLKIIHLHSILVVRDLTVLIPTVIFNLHPTLYFYPPFTCAPKPGLANQGWTRVELASCSHALIRSHTARRSSCVYPVFSADLGLEEEMSAL